MASRGGRWPLPLVPLRLPEVLASCFATSPPTHPSLSMRLSETDRVFVSALPPPSLSPLNFPGSAFLFSFLLF